MNEKLDCVVSLTTWKGRIDDPHVPRVIFRLLRQKTHYNYKVVLVLSEEEFGKEHNIPKEIEMLQGDPKFEILWTYENTYALKKLDPTMAKYPDVPVITTDDDLLLREDSVEMMMLAHKAYSDAILGTICGYFNGILRVGGVRLYPPQSLADLPLEYFRDYFHCLQDDEWNGIRAKVKGTRMLKIADRLILNMRFCDVNPFHNKYNKFSFRTAFDKFKLEHKEYNL